MSAPTESLYIYMHIKNILYKYTYNVYIIFIYTLYIYTGGAKIIERN